LPTRPSNSETSETALRGDDREQRAPVPGSAVAPAPASSNLNTVLHTLARLLARQAVQEALREEESGKS
jgi:hypothetical protein